MESSSSLIVSTLRTSLSRLSQPITDVDDLVDTLKIPLDALGIPPPSQKSLIFEPQLERKQSLPSSQAIRLVASIQHAILTNVVPSWDVPLREQRYDFALSLIEQYFCPGSSTPSALEPKSTFSNTSFELALSAYSVLLVGTESMSSFSLRVLSRLLTEFPADSIYAYLLLRKDGSSRTEDEGRRLLDWEQFVKIAGSLDSRVANATQGRDDGVPTNLKTRCVAKSSITCVLSCP